MTEKTFIPPASVAAAARKGLEMRRKFKRGGTSVGAARAGQLSNRNPVSLSTVRRIKAYFDRHQVDKQGKDWGNTSNPSAGFVAWYLWGADSSWSWAKGILAKHDKKSVTEETTSADIPPVAMPAGMVKKKKKMTDEEKKFLGILVEEMLSERSLSETDLENRDKYAKRMKKYDQFQGKEGKSLKYALATKFAKQGMSPPPKKKK